ncbi:uncharacterized protein LOC123796620 [Ursus americanus]|uniref:uncharacterized protein LOC123796620 n=1 Tax=Ursus americanus TaxID=9643 RepID=UPI001E67A256|nr:uncharacterized protein LOC123796620 [Ursus americanus]
MATRVSRGGGRVPELASRGSTAPRTFFQTHINETSRRSGRRRRRRTRRKARRSRGSQRSRRSRRKERGPRGAREPRGAAGSSAVGATGPPPVSWSPPLPGPPRPGRTEPRYTAARGESPRQPSWDGGPKPPPGAPEATCVLEANFCLPRAVTQDYERLRWRCRPQSLPRRRKTPKVGAWRVPLSPTRAGRPLLSRWPRRRRRWLPTEVLCVLHAWRAAGVFLISPLGFN